MLPLKKPLARHERMIPKGEGLRNLYVDFKVATWEKNRTELLRWVDEHHPELNGFLYDQTEAGGMKFLKAIELYQYKK